MSFSGFPSLAAQGGSFSDKFGPGLVAGGLAAATGIYSANKAAASARDSDNTSKQIAQGTLDAQLAGILESRQLAKANLGSTIWDATSAATWRPDLAFGRGKTEALFQKNTLDPMDFANKLAAARGEIGLRGSSETKALEQAANRENLKRTLAEKQGQMMGMFGRIAPVDTSTLFV